VPLAAQERIGPSALAMHDYEDGRPCQARARS
jgi:hypothetical protein